MAIRFLSAGPWPAILLASWISAAAAPAALMLPWKRVAGMSPVPRVASFLAPAGDLFAVMRA